MIAAQPIPLHRLQRSVDREEQFFARHRLGQVRAAQELCLFPSRVIVGRSEENEREIVKPVIPPNSDTQLQAIHVRHLDVADHEVERLLMQGAQRLRGVAHRFNLVAVRLEVNEHRVAKRRFFGHEQDSSHANELCFHAGDDSDIRFASLAVAAP
jgi:hypothetical protein